METLNLCDILGRQRTFVNSTLTGNNSRDPTDLNLLPSTYHDCVREIHTKMDGHYHGSKKVSQFSQRVRDLSPYVWILMTLSLTFRQMVRLADPQRILDQIRKWIELYPISLELKEHTRRYLDRLKLLPGKPGNITRIVPPLNGKGPIKNPRDMY
jgi:hypothetical protein